MKKVLSTMAALAVTGFAVNCLGEAAIYLNNYDLDRPIFWKDTSTKAPMGTTIQISGGATGAALTPIGAAFGLTEPGYFDNGFGNVAGAADNANVDLLLKGEYIDAGGIKYTDNVAWSQKAGANPGAPTLPTPATLDLPSGSVVMEVPEPSTIALALLGGSLLFLRRRS